MAQSNAEKIRSAKQMLAGLKENPARFAKRGLNKAALSEFEKLFKKAQACNNKYELLHAKMVAFDSYHNLLLDVDQHTLKENLATKTAELEDLMKDLGEKMSGLEKMVKTEFPQENWDEFGVTDRF